MALAPEALSPARLTEMLLLECCNHKFDELFLLGYLRNISSDGGVTGDKSMAGSKFKSY